MKAKMVEMVYLQVLNGFANAIQTHIHTLSKSAFLKYQKKRRRMFFKGMEENRCIPFLILFSSCICVSVFHFLQHQSQLMILLCSTKVKVTKLISFWCIIKDMSRPQETLDDDDCSWSFLVDGPDVGWCILWELFKDIDRFYEFFSSFDNVLCIDVVAWSEMEVVGQTSLFVLSQSW